MDGNKINVVDFITFQCVFSCLTMLTQEGALTPH